MWNTLGAAAAIAEILSLVVAWVAYRQNRILRTGLVELDQVPEVDRAPLIEMSLDRFGVAAAGLTRKDRFAILEQMVERRAERFRLVVWAGLAAAVLFAVLAAYSWTLPPSVYRLRVTVVGPDGRPVSLASLSTSVGGEVLAAREGWEIVLPGSRWGQTVTVSASQPDAFLAGRREVMLGDEREPPAIEIRLARREVEVRGIVVGPDGLGVAGATVSVLGHEEEAVTTGKLGEFRLPAHVADGQAVHMRVLAGARPGKVTEFWARAGDHPQRLILESP